MDWYYMQGEDQMGPVTEEDLTRLARDGTIQAETYVWREGFDDWHPYKELAGAIAGTPPVRDMAMAQIHNEACVECEISFPVDDMVRYGEHWVCEDCKPLFVQRIKEGVALPGVMTYGGFWIRFLAKILDGMITGAIGGAVQVVLTGALGAFGEEGLSAGIAIGYVANIAIGIGYVTFFIGRFAATPGKMVCGLKVVRADGERLTYMRAMARGFAEILSGLTLSVGYIIAAFDDQKRTLHDYICDTRVVRT